MNIDKKTINYIKKSVEIHLNILNCNVENILFKDQKSKQSIENSIEHLNNILNILKDKELIEKKRKVYRKYIYYKRKYMNSNNVEERKVLKKKMQIFLEYYITLKELCENI